MRLVFNWTWPLHAGKRGREADGPVTEDRVKKARVSVEDADMSDAAMPPPTDSADVVSALGASATTTDSLRQGGADVEMAEGDAEAAATAARFRDERTVFVKGLRMGLRDGELDATFRACGDFVEVRLMRDSDGRFRVRGEGLSVQAEKRVGYDRKLER